MRSSHSEQTGGAGISHVKEKFQDINWGPVDNDLHDLGVDLFVQVRDHRRFDRVAFAGVQVKAGDRKYFAKPEKDPAGKVVGWWYYEEDADHFDDWVQHGLPHLLVLVTDGPKRKAYWAHVTATDVLRTGKGCKILVPKSQRINWKSFDALMAAATSAKATPDLQGSLYRAGPNSVPPARALRHALLAPRLIAPHSRLGYDRALTPEEAIALITGGKAHELGRYNRRRAVIQGQTPPGDLNRELVAASETSRDWRWRLFHALRAFALDGDIEPAVRLGAAATTVANQPKELRAAAIVVAATALMDSERWDDAAQLLGRIGDDYSPVDHGWLLTHRAQVLVEQNDIAQARSCAAEGLKNLGADSDDVTARAISSAAATVLLSTASLDAPEREDQIGTLDTAVSWWRSGEIAAALDRADDISFTIWSSSHDTAAELSDTSQQQLAGAWLAAFLSGNRAASSWPLALRMRHEIQHQQHRWRDARCDEGGPGAGAGTETAQAARTLSAAMDALRRYGQHEDLHQAATRLWVAGPTEPVRDALHRSTQHSWRPATARAHIALLTAAGDLLDAETADTAARQCLDALDDLPAFRRQARPTFVESHFMPQALRTVLLAATDDVHEKALNLVLTHLSEADPHREGDLEVLAENIRTDVFMRHGKRVREAAMPRPGSLAAAFLQKLSAGGDEGSRAELRRRADTGDTSAAAAIGRPADLSDVAARRLIDDDVEGCRKLLTNAARGAYSPTAAASNLLAMNLAFPQFAQWEPILDVIFDPRVVAEAKASTVRTLTVTMRTPDDVLLRLRQRFSEAGPHAASSAASLRMSANDIAADSFALAVAVGAVSSTDAFGQVLTWLRGSTTKRRGAYRVVNALGSRATSPLIQGGLVMLTADPQPLIRGAAAAALIRGTEPGAQPEVEQAILAAAGEAGCVVPLAVAETLSMQQGAWSRRAHIRDQLLAHMSGRVRQAVNHTPAIVT